MSLSPSKKSNPCPICENASGKCRQSKNDSDYWQCMTYGDARKGEIVSGFKCIGHTKGSLWGQFKLDTSQEWSEQQRQDWHQENQRRRQKKAKEDEQRRRQSLSIEERDQQYRQMLSGLSLHPDDRADLVRRGFTHQQIELSGFKSIERYQQLQSKFSPLLPGVGNGGHTLLVEGGYLCPVRNPDGLIVALQLRLRGIDLNKYRWESSKTEKNPQGQSPHLYDWEVPELPLAVHYPAEARDSNRIGLTEGTGAKPFLASQRLGIPVIGAAGGQFPSSPNQLKAYLQQIGERLGTQQDIIFTLFPDAGAIQNKSVLNQIHKTVELLEKSGYRVEIGWWNQTDKTHPDIDELPLEQLADIQYLSLAEFKAIAKGDSIEATAQKKGSGSGYQEKAKTAWRQAKRFTAGIRKASQWCDWELPPSHSIFFGKGGLGRGKTTLLIDWSRVWKEEGKGFIVLGYRNTLLIQMCKKLGFYHLHESNSALMRQDPSGGIALCVDSLWRFKPEEFEGKILILDEVMSVIKHLLHSPTVKGRDKILKLFQEALQRASQVICLDGCLADWAVKYLHELAPAQIIITAENTFQGDKPKINFLIGTTVEEEIRANDRSPWLDYLLNSSQVPAVCSDSQVFIESLDNLLTQKGLKTLRIDSKTVPESYVKEFLEDCNIYIEKNRPDAILYTPSAESGVDVSIKNYFTDHFGFFFGVLGVDPIIQMLGRIRDIKCTKFVWVREWVAQSEQTHSRSPFAKKIGQAIEKVLHQDITDTVGGIEHDQEIISKLWAIIQGSKDAHSEASNQIQAIENYEKSHLRECVLETLTTLGCKVKCCTLNPLDEVREQVKKATEEVKRQNCHDIFTAEKVASEFANELSQKFDARWEERVKAIQASYRDRLPGIDETQSWTEDFIYKIRYENPDFISQQELFWLFKHPEEAKQMNLEHYHRLAQKERTFIGNIRSRMAKVKALREINFEQFLNPEKIWREDSPELIKLVEQCQDEKIAAALGRHPGQQTNIRFLGSLLKMLGLKHKGKKVKSAGGDYRVYFLDSDTLSDPDRTNALNCLDRRWENYVKKEVEVLDWNPVLNLSTQFQQGETNENFTCQQAWVYSQEAKSAQSQSGQDFDSVPRTPTEYIYTLEASWNQSDQAESQRIADQIVEGVACGLVEEIAQDLSLCDCPEMVAGVVGMYSVLDGYHPRMLEEAIALRDSIPQRNQLRAWLEALTSPSELPAGEQPPDPSVSDSEPEKPQIRQGSQVRVRESVARCRWVQGLSGIVESIAGLGRCVVRFVNGRIEHFDDGDLIVSPSG